MKANQGDIVSVDFPFSDGTETKRRPALVLSSEAVHTTGDVLLMQITSKSKKDGLGMALEDNVLNPPLPLKSFLRLHKVFTLDHQLIVKKISRLERSKFNEAIQAFFILLKSE